MINGKKRGCPKSHIIDFLEPLFNFFKKSRVKFGMLIAAKGASLSAGVPGSLLGA
jgi:hypothetical protein